MTLVRVNHAFVSSAAEGADASKVRTSNWNANLTLTRGPAFSVYLSADQTPANSTFTKILYDTEDLDSDNAFASSRFTPQVAGWYQIQAIQTFAGDSGISGNTQLQLYKNGANFARLGAVVDPGQPAFISLGGSRLVFLNGSTDYLEVFGFITSTTIRTIYGTTALSNFSGFFVRP